MAKKYKLLPKQLVQFTDLRIEGKEVAHRMHRIKALRDIPSKNVKAGDLGGWVSRRGILSHDDDSWIGENAKVYIQYFTNTSRVADSALVTGQAIVYGLGDTAIEIDKNAIVEGYANIVADIYGAVSYISGTAQLSGYAFVKNCKTITGNVSESASVTGDSYVLNNAHVNGNAKVVSSHVTDMAKVTGDASVIRTLVRGNALIKDDPKIVGAQIYGDATISGRAQVHEKAVVCENATVTGRAVVHKDSIIAGTSIVKDDAVVPDGARVLGDSIISKNAVLHAYEKYTDFISEVTPALTAAPNPKALTSGKPSSESSAVDVYEIRLKLDGLEKEIGAYGNDIVKLLKFPVMSDLRDENTLEMMLALKNAKSLDPQSNPKKFRKSVNSLERKFMKAESNARIICATAFSDEQRKKADKARDLFAIACNEASSEQEKKNAFKQGFRQLEGVVAVTDSAVENMRIKVGIPELEA